MEPTNGCDIKPIASFGSVKDLIAEIDEELARFIYCFSNEADKIGTVKIKRDYELSSSLARNHFVKRGLRSAAAVPLLNHDRCIGVLSIISSNPLGFEEEELELLTAMSADLAFGVQTLRKNTEHTVIKEKLRDIAFIDQLTGASNRSFLRTKLAALTLDTVATVKNISFLLVNIDDFRFFNDTWGYDYGDRLLIEATQRLASCVGDRGVICRHDGDQFAILLNNLQHSDNIASLIEQIQHSLIEFSSTMERKVTMTTSIGVAIYPDHGQNLLDLTQAATAALQRAKNSGKNCYRMFDSSMFAEAAAHRTLHNQLTQALQNDEFILHYQPKHDVLKGRVAGVEALIRWAHPVHGLVGPANFIEAAEKMGLIIPIGEWVINTACEEFAKLMRSGLPLETLAINVSAVQFRSENLLKTVVNALSLNGLSAHHIELELTESTFLGDTDSTIRTLRDLRSLGVRVSIDDFGTGYSNLGYLRSIGVDRLKIDRSFIRDILQHADAQAIVKIIVQLGQNLKLAVTAEGVETIGQRRILEDLGCDELQGYLIGRPVPADELVQLLSSSAMHRHYTIQGG